MVFLWIAWIMILFRVIFDIFRSHDMGGFAKALWAIFVVIVPFLGVFVYLIARGGSMASGTSQAQPRRLRSARTSRSRRLGGGTADELAKLADLKAQGVITDAEFEQQKAKLLG